MEKDINVKDKKTQKTTTTKAKSASTGNKTGARKKTASTGSKTAGAGSKTASAGSKTVGVEKKKKNIHDGHRKRMKHLVGTTPELDSLTDIGVLEYLLSFLVPRKDTNPIAHDLLSTFTSIYGVINATSHELIQIKNMTNNAAHFLPNITSIVRRAAMSRTQGMNYIRTVKEALAYLSPFFINRHSERLYLISLDVNDRIIQIDLLSEGTGNTTPFDIAKILAIISRIRPVYIILAHNHPGGTIVPSNSDYAVTQSLAQLLVSMGINIRDHIIFTSDDFFSMYKSDMDSGANDFGNSSTTEETRRRSYRHNAKAFIYEEKQWPDIEYSHSGITERLLNSHIPLDD